MEPSNFQIQENNKEYTKERERCRETGGRDGTFVAEEYFVTFLFQI